MRTAGLTNTFNPYMKWDGMRYSAQHISQPPVLANSVKKITKSTK